jgi:tetratricopeptide (TPR) repeat protein
MTPTVFLSCVTAEFGDLRSRLARMVRRTHLLVRHQDDFAHRGVLTLQKLEEEVCASDVVFHILGKRSGTTAPRDQADAFLQRHPNFGDRFPDVATAGREAAVTYTQWEAWFALYFGKRLCSYKVTASATAPLPEPNAEQVLQQVHEEHLRKHKAYPDPVADVSALLEEILASLVELHLIDRQEIEARPCNLPYRSLGELFIGRGLILDDLRRRFEEARRQRPNGWPNQVVTGMAGVGKTRMAVEYGWRHRDDYTALLFVNGESPASLDSHLANLAGVLRLNLPVGAGDIDRRAAVLDWLKRHPGWLLIVDNVDDEAARDAVNGYVRDWHDGHVLITGRYVEWSRDVERLGLHVLSRADAADFLLRSTSERHGRADDAAHAGELADDLGGLCLALEQCSAYVNRLGISLEEYPARWQANARNVRTWADKVLMKYHEEKTVSLSIATTWQTTLDQLSPAARQLLHLLCWLGAEPIPQTLFDEIGRQSVLPGDVEDATAELRSYSLLYRSAEAGFPTPGEMHRLVRLITREQLAEDERKSSLPWMLNVVNAAFTGDPIDVRSWPVLNPLAGHAAAAAQHADRAGIGSPTGRLMNNVGVLYSEQARFGEAEALLRRALAIDDCTFGSNHPNVAAALNNLAMLLKATNRLVEAEPLMWRALGIDERRFGPDHSNVATDLNNLASLLEDTNRLGEAEPLMWRALAIDERSLGPDHPNVATRLNNLALLLQATNRLAQAEPLMRRALAVDERAFGPDHPNVARDLNNLAWLLKETNRLAEAEPLMRRVVEIFENSLGKSHPNVATTLNNLAQLLQDTFRLGEAESLMRRALGIYEHSLGPEHPEIATVLNNLAQLLHATNRLAEAEPMVRRALDVFSAFTRRTRHLHPRMRAALATHRRILEALGHPESEIQAALAALEEPTP